ncbi:MAG: MTH1187 family thiamine-binding protein [Candidatus Caldatribacteriota bacterium]|nr:MTH1187 family thiamine-binding protein [Candidatus Caldatribacteriota bacterium]
MPRVNVSFQILPVVKEERIYEIVDKVIEYIDKSGVKYEVGAMETTMEGDFDKLMDIVKESQQICVKEGAARIVSIIKIDYKSEGVTINEKVKKYRK